MILNNTHLLLLFPLTVSCLISIEIGIRSKPNNQLSMAMTTIKQSTHIILSSKISDHWKEKIIPIYALTLFKHSLSLLLILVGMCSPFFISQLMFKNFGQYCMSILGILLSVVISYIYIKKIR